jgi:putative ABC transport system substrate-binding protein
MKKAAVPSILVAVVLLALGVIAEAQQPKKVHRIGYLSNRDPASESARAEAIRLALRELGYIEGQNIAIEYRYAEAKLDQLPELAAELVRLKVDIIVTGGDQPIQAAKNATKTIPIVMTGAGIDPVVAGFVESLACPGGNVTGLTNLFAELGGKRLELLKEAVPKLARVAVLYDAASLGSLRENKEVLPVAARALGLTVRSWEVRAADGFERVFAALNKQPPDGLYVSPGALMSNNQKWIVDFALKSRLPSVYVRKEFVEAGGLMSYGADLADSYRRAAYYVDRILKGAKPADLPVEQPTKFELVINLKTAEQIGLTIPQSMLYRADKVIK